MPKLTLPRFLQPCQTESLIRLGNHQDGGYLVDRRSILAADALIGLGINDDWSFEKDFYAAKPVPIFGIDGTISERGFRRRLRHSFMRFKPKEIKRDFALLQDYRTFFSGKRQHVAQLIGFDDEGMNWSFATMMQRLQLDRFQNLFLKIDIEGSEYRILEDLIVHENAMVGLVVEFHDVDINLPRIQDFINRYQLSLCHVHVNNISGINQGVPLVIECSFTRFPLASARVDHLPHPLDAPNHPKFEEITLQFAD